MIIPSLTAAAVAKFGQPAMMALRTAARALVAGQASGSLTGYSGIGRVEPLALIDEDLKGADTLTATMEITQSLFAAHYLRAVSMHNITIGGASIGQRLEQFSTHRNAGTAAALALSAATPANESYDDALPFYNQDNRIPQEVLRIAQEAFGDFRENGSGELIEPRVQREIDEKDRQDKLNRLSSVLDNNNNSIDSEIKKNVDIVDAGNLATGKLINVTLRHEKNSVTVPVSIHLNCQYMATAPLVHILAAGSKDISFGARWKKYWHGGIDFWNDLIFCQDLIDEHRKNLKADKTGIYLQMMQKRNSNSKAALVSGLPSANSASNIVVLSAETVKQLEFKIGGKISDYQTRQRLFQQGYGMILVVIDRQWGRVRFYTRDIPEHTDIGEKTLNSTAKQGGPDINDVLSAFRAGSAARL